MVLKSHCTACIFQSERVRKNVAHRKLGIIWMTREITKMMVMLLSIGMFHLCNEFEMSICEPNVRRIWKKKRRKKNITRASSISIAGIMAKKNLLNCKIDFSKKWKTQSARTNRQKRWLSLVKLDTKCRIYDYAVKARKLLHLFCGMIKVAGKYFPLNDSGFERRSYGAANRRWAATCIHILANYQSLSLNHKLLFCISEINDFYRCV